MTVNKNKETKTYSLQSLIIIVFLLLIISIVLILIRSMKADEIVTKIKATEKTIASLNKELTILKAEEAKYAAPNRFLEIAISSGTISPRGENDIIYLKLESEYESKIAENARDAVILEENVLPSIETKKEEVKKKTVRKEISTSEKLKENTENSLTEKNNESNNNTNNAIEENTNSYEIEINFKT